MTPPLWHGNTDPDRRRKGETRYHADEVDPDVDDVTGGPADCSSCGGTGRLRRAKQDNKGGKIGYEVINCGDCKGTGKIG
jgi:hypothetical protein